MSSAVLLSIRPEWVEKIANGEKTIEMRKSRPKLDPPFKCYIYCTQGNRLAFMKPRIGTNLIACTLVNPAIPFGGFVGNGKVIGEFTCKTIDEHPVSTLCPHGYAILCGMTRGDLMDYGKGKPLYGWHISDLKIYDEPKALADFGLKRPPQSWCYVEER